MLIKLKITLKKNIMTKINDILPDEEVFTLVDGDPKTKISEIIGNKKVVLFVC